MMRVILFSLLFLIASCNKDAFKSIDTENKETVSRKGVPICILNLMNNADTGGTWVSDPTNPMDLSSYLIGSNPCIDFGPFICGVYKLNYTVGDICCQKTSVLTVRKCCQPTSFCTN